MKRLLAPRRREDDRTSPGLSEQLDGRVDGGHVHQPAGPDLKLRKPLSVRAKRSVVVHTGGEVPEVRCRKPFARHGLEIEHVDRVVGRRDDRAARDVAGSRGDSLSINVPGGTGQEEQRATGQEPKEPATMKSTDGRCLHDSPPGCHDCAALVHRAARMVFRHPRAFIHQRARDNVRRKNSKAKLKTRVPPFTWETTSMPSTHVCSSRSRRRSSKDRWRRDAARGYST